MNRIVLGLPESGDELGRTSTCSAGRDLAINVHAATPPRPRARGDLVTDLGADAVCNNRNTDVAAWAREQTRGQGVHVVFDHVGEALWAASMFSLAPRGRLVNCGGTTGQSPTIPNLGYMYHMGLQLLGSDPYRYEEFAPAWADYCAGDYQAVVDSVYPLVDAAQAQEKLLSGTVFGKIVVEI